MGQGAVDAGLADSVGGFDDAMALFGNPNVDKSFRGLGLKQFASA
jgi:hypothetical protein